MDLFYEPHRTILKKLLDYDVEFLLVGGYAVNYHGYNRPTGDMDIWFNPTEPNREKLMNLLKEYDFDEESLSYVRNIDLSKLSVFHIGEAPIRIDFLTHLSGIIFFEAYKERLIDEVGGMQIPILNLNDLVLSKITNQRTKDKLDVEELQKIQQLRNKG